VRPFVLVLELRNAAAGFLGSFKPARLGRKFVLLDDEDRRTGLMVLGGMMMFYAAARAASLPGGWDAPTLAFGGSGLVVGLWGVLGSKRGVAQVRGDIGEHRRETAQGFAALTGEVREVGNQVREVKGELHELRGEVREGNALLRDIRDRLPPR
jgi:hypothetical protein